MGLVPAGVCDVVGVGVVAWGIVVVGVTVPGPVAAGGTVPLGEVAVPGCVDIPPAGTLVLGIDPVGEVPPESPSSEQPRARQSPVSATNERDEVPCMVAPYQTYLRPRGDLWSREAA